MPRFTHGWLALLLWAAGLVGCGRLGFDSISPDAGGIDSGRSDAAPRDASADASIDADLDAGFDSGADCTAGTPAYPSVQSVLDDATCAVVFVPAGVWGESLSVDRAVMVVGEGIDLTRLSGLDAARALSIGTSGDVHLLDLSLTSGLAAVGAGVDTRGRLELERVRVTANHGVGSVVAGAGIAAHDADVILRAGTEIHANTLDASGTGLGLSALGAGIFMEGASLLEIAGGVTISENRIDVRQEGGPTETGGGGIALRSGVTLSMQAGAVFVRDNIVNQLALTDTVFPASASGGGIDCRDSSLQIGAGSVFSGNQVLAEVPSLAQSTARGGGGALERCVALISNIHFSSNTAQASTLDGLAGAFGGGLDVQNSTVAISSAIFRDNLARTVATGSSPVVSDIGGGGVHVSGGDVTIFARQIHDNRVEASSANGAPAGWGGGVGLGAIGSAATLVTIESSTLGPNNAVSTASDATGPTMAQGGGVGLTDRWGAAVAEVVLVNSTVSGNTVEANATNTVDSVYGAGVGVHRDFTGSDLSARLIHTTVTANRGLGVSRGGGVGAASFEVTPGLLHLQNSVVHGNTVETGTESDCLSLNTTVVVTGSGILGVASGCSGDISSLSVGVDPLLGPLANNSGSTLTHAIDAMSPARDSGPAPGCQQPSGVPLDQDQRMLIRSDACDLGSFEVQ